MNNKNENFENMKFTKVRVLVQNLTNNQKSTPQLSELRKNEISGKLFFS